MAKILIIEKDLEIIGYLTFFMEHFGHEVISTQSPKEGLEIFEKEKPDAVIAEFSLQPIDGMSITETAKKITQTSQLFVLTDHPLIHDSNNFAKKIHATAVFSKPFNFSEITERIKA